MFERFTGAARGVVVQAQEEARGLQHDRIGTEHLLLAVLASPGNAAGDLVRAHGLDHTRARAQVERLAGAPRRPLEETSASDAEALRAIGIDLDAVRRAIEENFGPDALRLPPPNPPLRRRGRLRRASGGPTGHIPFSPGAKKTLELALREAIRLGHSSIGAEHVALGLLRDGGGRAHGILTGAGVDPDALRADLERSLRKDAA